MKKEKILYTCEMDVDAIEYGKMVQYFPRVYWSYVLNVEIISLIIAIIVAIFSKNIILTIMIFVLYSFVFMIAYKVKLSSHVENTYRNLQRKNEVAKKVKIEFYENYFIFKSEIKISKFEYSHISRSIETNTSFYFDANKKMGFIKKEYCELELISFIRKKFKNLENHLGESKVVKKANIKHNPKFVKIMMLILFVLTILSLGLGLLSSGLMVKINNVGRFETSKTMWVCWLWLPIPILSIILGFRYYNAGYKCLKNIIAGFIVAFHLMVFGAFVFFPRNAYDYNLIYDYEEILGIELPNDGDLLINYNVPNSKSNRSNYIIVTAYYDEISTELEENMFESIKNNNNWFFYSDANNDLQSLLFATDTFEGEFQEDTYYSIYNKTLGEYNIVPIENGNYEIYVMEYNISTKILTVQIYNLSK